MQIWKYGLVVTDEQFVSIPKVIQFLDIQSQYGLPQIWALVDDATAPELYKVQIVGTGNPVPEALGQYLGTFQMYNGNLVFHAFIEKV